MNCIEKMFIFQISIRERRGYGHYTLAFVNGVNFYMFNSNGNPGNNTK